MATGDSDGETVTGGDIQNRGKFKTRGDFALTKARRFEISLQRFSIQHRRRTSKEGRDEGANYLIFSRQAKTHGETEALLLVVERSFLFLKYAMTPFQRIVVASFAQAG